MKRILVSVIFGILLGGVTMMMLGQSVRGERMMHPRLAAAIEALKDARAYLQGAPHDFGGHKTNAIRATNEAIRQLNLALAYRAREDRRR